MTLLKGVAAAGVRGSARRSYDPGRTIPHVLKKWLEFPAEWGPTEWGPNAVPPLP